jgi:hypothetical protein
MEAKLKTFLPAIRVSTCETGEEALALIEAQSGREADG